MYQVIIVVHVLLGMGVIGLILMQQGKGADAGAAFGSGASGSVFGAQGAASFLSRTTAILATSFFITSLSLAILGGKQEKPVDLMDTPETVQKMSDVPVANTPVAPTVSSGTEAKPELAVPLTADKPAVTAPAQPVAVDAAAKVEDNKTVAADKAKTEPNAKAADAKKSDSKVKVLKDKDRKEAEKKHKAKSDKKEPKSSEKK